MAAYALHLPAGTRRSSRLVIWVGVVLIIASLFVAGDRVAKALAPAGQPTGPTQLIAPS